MAGYQCIIIIGNVGGEPELRYTNSGVAVCNFSVAVNDVRDKDAPPTWYRVTCWRQTAEFAHEYVKKGDAVLVHGERLVLSEWTDRDGNPRVTLELTAQKLVALGRRADAQVEGQTEQSDLPF